MERSDRAVPHARKRSSRGALTYLGALTLALLSALAWGASAADADEASTIIERCTHGQSLSGFSPAAYTTALQELSPEVREYTNCEALIRAAESTAVTPTSPEPSTSTPVLGQTETAQVTSGTVTVRLKGTHKFVTLSALAALPNGSEVDATHGHVVITAATPSGGTQTAEAYSGRFVIHQAHTGTGKTGFTLSQPLTGCRRRVHPRGRARTARLARKHRRAGHTHGPRSRHLWVREHGGAWATHGRYVSTSVEGTRWLTIDRCGRSVVKVAEGRVKVRDLVRKRTKTVTAGHSYIASRASRQRRHR
jgi:hypothetical protein